MRSSILLHPVKRTGVVVVITGRNDDSSVGRKYLTLMMSKVAVDWNKWIELNRLMDQIRMIERNLYFESSLTGAHNNCVRIKTCLSLWGSEKDKEGNLICLKMENWNVVWWLLELFFLFYDSYDERSIIVTIDSDQQTWWRRLTHLRCCFKWGKNREKRGADEWVSWWSFVSPSIVTWKMLHHFRRKTIFCQGEVSKSDQMKEKRRKEATVDNIKIRPDDDDDLPTASLWG